MMKMMMVVMMMMIRYGIYIDDDGDPSYGIYIDDDDDDSIYDESV